jgi:hypothetical protein
MTLLELGWTYRRIEAETGVRRETVSRYDRLRRSNAAKVLPGCGSKAAKVFPGPEPPARSAAAAYHEVIVEKLESRLTLRKRCMSSPSSCRKNMRER